jgi:hypothetical protein
MVRMTGWLQQLLRFEPFLLVTMSVRLKDLHRFAAGDYEYQQLKHYVENCFPEHRRGLTPPPYYSNPDPGARSLYIDPEMEDSSPQVSATMVSSFSTSKLDPAPTVQIHMSLLNGSAGFRGPLMYLCWFGIPS